MKTILVTGSTGNLGEAVLENLISQKHNVIVLVQPGKAKRFDGVSNITPYEADLIDEAAVSKTIATVINAHKKIDAALLLVGGYAFGGIHDADGATVKKMIALNFETAYFTARPVFQHMQQAGEGRIVLVGARPALDAKAGKTSVAYALSKSLIFSLAELLNAEGASKNVVTSVIVPSIIDTPVNRSSMPNANFSAWVKPSEIADAISFLIHEKGSVVREPVLKLYGNA